MKRRPLRGAALVALVATAIAAAVLSPSGDGLPDAPATTTVERPEGRVRVEVLNAGGVSGMARDATRRLRSVGFDVVDFRSARPFDSQRPSAVIDRVGRTDVAQAVADALGIDNVQSEPGPNFYVDVSVLLGSEWTTPNATGATHAGASDRAWWDPRGWLGR